MNFESPKHINCEAPMKKKQSVNTMSLLVINIASFVLTMHGFFLLPLLRCTDLAIIISLVCCLPLSVILHEKTKGTSTPNPTLHFIVTLVINIGIYEFSGNYVNCSLSKYFTTSLSSIFIKIIGS